MQSQKRIQKYQFNLKQLLGQGSYASVYRGKIIQTGQPVAVKVIDKRLFTNSFNLKNLHSEIEIMKKVKHRNIVQLHDVYQTTNNMYIITEMCDYDMLHFLQQRRKLPEQQAVNLLQQIMKGAKYLNLNGIVHRDLKPANILLKDGECKLSDFGFAKVQEGSVLRSIVGTPLYMSPQLLQKQRYSNKSDLWSIGLIYYEMLHGRTPWNASNQLQLISAIHSQKVQYSKLISQLSIDFIHRCLKISEEERMSWEQAFDHPLLRENQQQMPINRNKSKSTMANKSAMIAKEDVENNSMLINFNDTQKNKEKRKQGLCLTPKLHKNISQIKLKKVEALTPKASFANINNKLKQVWALSNYPTKKDREDRNIPDQKKPIQRKRHLTTQFEAQQFNR